MSRLSLEYFGQRIHAVAPTANMAVARCFGSEPCLPEFHARATAVLVKVHGHMGGMVRRILRNRRLLLQVREGQVINGAHSKVAAVDGDVLTIGVA